MLRYGPASGIRALAFADMRLTLPSPGTGESGGRARLTSRTVVRCDFLVAMRPIYMKLRIPSPEASRSSRDRVVAGLPILLLVQEGRIGVHFRGLAASD
jgi:hypothetical protein